MPCLTCQRPLLQDDVAIVSCQMTFEQCRGNLAPSYTAAMRPERCTDQCHGGQGVERQWGGRAMPQRRAEIRIASWPRADRASSERPLGARPLDPRSRTVDERPFMPPAVACPLPRPMPRPRLLHWPRARACNVPSASSRFESEDVSRLAETNLAVQFQRPQPRADDKPDRGAHFPHGAADRSPLLLRAPAANKKRLTPRSGVYRADRLWTGRPCCRTLWDFLAQVKINPHLPSPAANGRSPWTMLEWEVRDRPARCSLDEVRGVRKTAENWLLTV